MSEEEAASSGAPGDQEPEKELSEEDRVLKENEPLLAELRAKHGRLGIFYDPWEFEGVLVCAKPAKPQTFREYSNALTTALTAKAGEPRQDVQLLNVNLALACTVHPSREAAKQIFEKLPLLAQRVAGKVQDLCGGGTKELGKG
jgi:hypothetical protein